MLILNKAPHYQFQTPLLCFSCCISSQLLILQLFNNKKNKGMQPNPCQLQQRQFQSDLDKLMKDMRSSQDTFLTIIQYILKIMRPSQQESCIFVNEDISHYRAIIAKIRANNCRYQEEYCAILQRYHQNASLPQTSDILMKRVIYRLLEIIFNSLSTVNNKIPHIFQEYLRLKINCQKIMQDNISNKSYLLFKSITDYEFKKITKYLQLFSELTNHLENGDLDIFSKVEINCFIQSRIAGKDSNMQTKTSFFSSLKVNKIRVKEKQASKPEIVTSQKQKSIFPRKAKALYDSLKDVIEINRHQFLEDYTCYTENTKDHLYKQLWARNKANHQNITDYNQKKRKIMNKMKAKMPVKEKSERIENQRPEEMFHNMEFKPITTTRKSLLLKLKANQKNAKPLPSELFRKTSKFEDARFRVKSYNRERVEDKAQAKDERQTKDQVEQAEQLLVEVGHSQALQERLPVLNKRAQSVDQNYKSPPDFSDYGQVRTLSNSLKINEQLKLKTKGEKVEMHPVKIKLQLKAMGMLSSLEVNRKLGKVGELGKYLYF